MRSLSNPRSIAIVPGSSNAAKSAPTLGAPIVRIGCHRDITAGDLSISARAADATGSAARPRATKVLVFISPGAGIEAMFGELGALLRQSDATVEVAQVSA